MNDRRRNQLIGTIALLLLVILVSPYVLKDKRLNEPESISLVQSETSEQSADILQERGADLPDQYAEVTQEQLQPTQPEVVAPTQPPAQIVAPTTEPTVIPPEEPTAPARVQATGKMYSIQLAALKNHRKIEELVALLRLHNYDVYTEPKHPAANQTVRLLVGPYPARQQAENVITDLKNLTKLNGIIVTR